MMIKNTLLVGIAFSVIVFAVMLFLLGRATEGFKNDPFESALFRLDRSKSEIGFPEHIGRPHIVDYEYSSGFGDYSAWIECLVDLQTYTEFLEYSKENFEEGGIDHTWFPREYRDKMDMKVIFYQEMPVSTVYFIIFSLEDKRTIYLYEIKH